MTPFIAEIIGTMLLILLGNGVVANVVLKDTKGNNSGWIVITTAWALAVFVGVTVAGPVSGAHLNPAVTIGLAVAKKFSWDLVPSYIAAQMIGAMAGAFLVWLFHKDHFAITEDEGGKLACFSTIPAISKPVSNLISEIIGTFVLVFVVFYISDAHISVAGDPSAKIGLGTVGALPVAFLVWAIGLSLGGTTGYAINPARDLGPRIMHAILPVKGSSQWSYAWIPITGPVIGAVIAALLFNCF
ncbi:MIP/aquaporin family protein [Elizabethkingia meningoseptica]|uniref:MIP/aquaporin family protein n=1 Tax=Elizabethkingia meningoseptica TaxID=238 RepID=UPI0009993C6D|nr:MIP/aquaporin family protein [Elizabethkingia meningoseptica]MCL1676134.1 aquaporin family protein [Elizabethkingia meningoseptica]MCL1684843.1 aquaporin family protein [Elizabethkingia meningoseptica]MDE5491278.1 aquaporin family protein [Elizabethkingia meningoseptica]MEC4713047.1 MIP/aquaporin family protein [Elizabethkingia meningoseptica]OPB94897.1 aquaporin [Elizabethkingia meningoseptica]